MAQAAAEPRTRSSRFWLYAPFVLLLLVAFAWSAGWFVIRGQVEKRLDALLAAESRAGRQWTCQDRTIGGYPFRIEIACAALSLRRGPMTASFGRTNAVAQVYQPRHVITHFAGPLRATDGQVTVDGAWTLMETSVRASGRGFERLSLVAREPNLRIVGAAPAEVLVSSQAFEAHLRPNPARFQAEGAFDGALLARQAKLPGIDAWVGGGEPTDVQLDVTATQAQSVRGRPVLDEVERWRNADGRLDIVQLALTKGARRLEAKGELRLDEMHRLAGQIQASAAGLDGLIANLTGGGAGGSLLGALLGQAPRPQAPAGSQPPALSPLPPVRLDNGRVLIGPFTVPNLRLLPLY